MFRWILLLLLLVIGALQYRLWWGESNIHDVWTLREQIQTQLKENERLQTRNRQLEAEVQDLRDGLSALEERARSGQGMIKEGETFYQLVDPLPDSRSE